MRENGGGGNTNLDDNLPFIQVTHIDFIEKISAGGSHSCFIDFEGKVLCWGYGANGRLGDAYDNDSSTSTFVLDVGEVQGGQPLRGATTVSSGLSHTCVLKFGEVFCWGEGVKGQLGNGSFSDASAPVRVKGDVSSYSFLEGVDQVSVGGDHSCALQSGEVLCWGSGERGAAG